MENKIDIEEEQRLAASYTPATTGPLVSEPQPLQLLANEWKDAETIIQTKLTNLLPTYPLWRRIRGDGSCGFRSMLFGWFEVWLQPNNTQLLDTQTQRLVQKWQSLGIDEMFSDWIDSVTQLTQQLVSASESGEDVQSVLLRGFNDEEANQELVQFLRMMTSSEMRANADQYQASLDQPLEQWTQENVDVPSAEMDFPSLVAAYNAIARASGITVHVIYLDNSKGTEATVHHLEPDEAVMGREIWLLYRPGHYDLVYKKPSEKI